MQHRIVIGDWSKDGHNQFDFFNFECSHGEDEIKKAYRAAVKKSKVSLHDEGMKNKAVAVCCDYQDGKICDEQINALKEIGVDFNCINGDYEDGGLSCSPETIAKLFFEMAKTQIPGFTYKLVEEKRPINGFWSKDFNFGFGYGCYQ